MKQNNAETMDVLRKEGKMKEKVDFLSRIKMDGDLISLTDLWVESRKGPGSHPTAWMRKKSAKIILEIVAVMNKDGVVLNRKTEHRYRGTYAHKCIALGYAKYLDERIYNLINDIFFKGNAKDVSDLVIKRRMFNDESSGDWKKIPGMPNYEINIKDYRVRSHARAIPRILTKNTYNYYLTASNGSRVPFTVPTLLYAVENNIDPLEIDARSLVIEFKGYGINVVKRKDYYAYIMGLAREKKVKAEDIDRGTSIDMCNKASDFYQELKKYYETGDMSIVVEYIYSHRISLIKYIYHKEFAKSESSAKDLAESAIELAIERIKNGNPVAMGVDKYLKGIIRRIVAAKRRENVISYRDFSQKRSIRNEEVCNLNY